MEEIWKDIEGYKGYYQISTLGHVKSLPRFHVLEERIIHLNKVKKYNTVSLHKNKKEKRYGVHRLVALAFISNPDNKPQVNHINGDCRDNRVENLEWMTSSENHLHAFRELHRTPTGLGKFGEASNRSRLIHQYTPSGEYLNSYCGAAEAQRITGIHRGTINGCLAHSYGHNTAGGFVWKLTKD